MDGCLPPDLLAMMNQVSNIAATGDDDEAREEAYNVLASMLLGQVDASSGPTVPTSHLPASPPPTATLPLTSNLLATQVTAEQPLPLVPSELATVETPMLPAVHVPSVSLANATAEGSEDTL